MIPFVSFCLCCSLACSPSHNNFTSSCSLTRSRVLASNGRARRPAAYRIENALSLVHIHLSHTHTHAGAHTEFVFVFVWVVFFVLLCRHRNMYDSIVGFCCVFLAQMKTEENQNWRKKNREKRAMQCSAIVSLAFLFLLSPFVGCSLTDCNYCRSVDLNESNPLRSHFVFFHFFFHSTFRVYFLLRSL